MKPERRRSVKRNSKPRVAAKPARRKCGYGRPIAIAEALVSGLDRSGAPQTIEGRDLLARAFHHEMDHLDGTVFVDRLRGIKRDLIVRKIQKLKRAGRWR